MEESKQLSENAGTIFGGMMEQISGAQVHVAHAQSKYAQVQQVIQELGQDKFRDRLWKVQETLTGFHPLTNRQTLMNDAIYLKVIDGMTRCSQILASAVILTKILLSFISVKEQVLSAV